MNIIPEDRCKEWLSAVMQEPFDADVLGRVYGNSVTYLIPSDTGKKTALARALSALVGSSRGGLLWITEWGVFPSSENMALFLGFRRSLGEERSVYAAPGHLFVEADLERVECLLDLVLYFFWDASIFDGSSIWLQLSHDEVFTLNARDQNSLRVCEEALSRYELKELSRRTS